MSLDKYHEKRDFGKTPEPRGKVKKSGKRLAFFIQKHHASHLHYDFRLELDGTLKSWAVPKGPSLDPKDKRLAVLVEDHPLDYGLFEGEIPAKQYGAGHVLVWDTGSWTPEGDAAESLRKGNLKFELDGVKLRGRWALVRMGRANQDGARSKENWLLIKENDDAARRGDEANITALLPDSVLDKTKPRAQTKTTTKPAPSGAPDKPANGAAASRKAKTEASTTKSVKAGPTGDSAAKAAKTSKSADPAKAAKAPKAAKTGKTTGSKRTAAGTKRSKQETPAKADQAFPVSNTHLDAVGQAIAAPMPATLKPQLATLTDKPPSGQDWLCEVKFDGYRALCRIEDGQAILYTRTGNDWTAKWQTLADAAAALPVDQAWLDGEVVAVDDDGNISFQALQNSVRNDRPERLAYYVFDLPYLNGHDLRQVALAERRRLLQALLPDDHDGPLLFSSHIGGDVADIFSHACRHGLEGIIAKRADAPYAGTRNGDWLKVKCQQRQEFVIGGYTDPAGAREKFGALLLGVFDAEGQLHFVGRVGTGFDDALLASLHAQFKNLARKTSPFVEAPPRMGAPALHWLKPTLVAEVKFAQWTQAGIVRHASFVALRDDKPAHAIRRELAVPVDVATGDTKPVARQASIAGVDITHASRVLYPEIGLTKLDLAQFYEDIADWVLPHLTQRPMTLVRCPNGDGKECFFQKHVNATTSAAIEHISVPSSKSGGSATYMTANTLPSLIGMVQMGVLELHTWGAHEGKLDRPDRIIFDLDPAPGLDWSRVVEAAMLVRALLDEIGLESFVKTTGGKGLHVVAPIVPQRPWDEVKDFTRAFAEHLEHQMPQRFTASMAKAKRGGKIFVDYLRNGAEATAVAAYSTRARPGAPVSVPVAWEELENGVRSDTFNVGNLRERLAQLKEDPWARYFKLKQKLGVRMIKAFMP